MKYTIEVDESMQQILTSNANKRNMSVPALITEMLRQYVIDAHIMEQNEMWKNGIDEFAEINLEWANL